MRLLLASQSPRRVALLEAAGFAFEVAPVSVDERSQEREAPAAYVARLSAAKALAVDLTRNDTVVLAADTVVVVDDVVFGKPADDREAADMLQRLAGRSHEVLTGVTVRTIGRSVTEVERTAVRFTAMSAGQIAWYVASGEPRDKAGAYAVQGLASRFVDRIEGSYSNVVGLPVATVYRLLRQVGAA